MKKMRNQKLKKKLTELENKDKKKTTQGSLEGIMKIMREIHPARIFL